MSKLPTTLMSTASSLRRNAFIGLTRSATMTCKRLPVALPVCFPHQNLPSTSTSTRAFSSHDDFAPQRKTVVDDEVQGMIEQHVKENPVMLYMKGTPAQPMCGFSATVIQVLQAEGVAFSSVNVLDYPNIREGVKKFSEWPTIPQLYVNGEFLGGCDIVKEMHSSGELKEALQDVAKKE